MFLSGFPAKRVAIFLKPEAAMAQYEHLPIYKKAYDLTLYFEQIVRNFSRYHKYTVGTELRQHSREALRLLPRGNWRDKLFSQRISKILLLECYFEK